MPPYLAFQLYSVASEIAVLARQIGRLRAGLVLASDIAMICSSVNLRSLHLSSPSSRAGL